MKGITLNQPWENEPEDISELVGFVYEITTPLGDKYIGKKLFWTHKKLPPLKGMRRARREWKETNWRKYWGSSAEIVYLRKQYKTGWRRVILRVCKSKWEMAYYEVKEQIGRDALLREDYINGLISVVLRKAPDRLIMPKVRTRKRAGK